MTRRSWLVLVVLSLAACRGPKGSPEGSVKSFFSAVEAEDWDAMADIISADSMKRIGSRDRAMATFARDFEGWKNVKINVEDAMENADGHTANVRFECFSTQYVNYKPKDYDCSDTFALVKEEDGKWHIHLPGGRLRPM
jgi:hypothetical protein